MSTLKGTDLLAITRPSGTDAGTYKVAVSDLPGVVVSDTAPTSPEEGDLWYDTVSARLFCWVNDGSTTQWADVTQPGGGGGASNWTRAGTTLSPATAGDDVDLGTGALSAAAGTFTGALTGATGTFSGTVRAGNAKILQDDKYGVNIIIDDGTQSASLTVQNESASGHKAITVYDGSTETITLNANGQIEAPGWYIPATAGGTISQNRRIQAASGGGASNAVFIGNAQIQVSSDERIKENIKDTELDAVAAIQKIKVKDFTWNDPNDISYNNRNARGVWTGVIAQELVEVLPFVVNAPRKEEDLSLDYESENIWTLDQSQLCPVLVKALQQTLTRIEALEAEVQALKGGN